MRERYIKISAFVYFLFSILVLLNFKNLIELRLLDSRDAFFPAINSNMPLMALMILIVYVGIVGVILLITTDSVNKKISSTFLLTYSITEEGLLKNHHKDKKKMYIKIIALVNFIISLILAFVPYEYYKYFLFFRKAGGRTGIFNPPSYILAFIVIGFGFISLLLLLINYDMTKKTIFMEENLKVLKDKNENWEVNDNIKKGYVKIFALLNCSISILLSLYLCKGYLKGNNFEDILLSIEDPTSKVHVVMLICIIIYVALISLIFLLKINNVDVKVLAIKEYMSTLLKDKNIKSKSSTSSSNFIMYIVKVFAWLNFIGSILVSMYIQKYFYFRQCVDDRFIEQRFLETNITNNPPGGVLIVIIMYIGIAVLLFLLVICNIYKNISYIEGNIDMLNNKE